MSEITEANKIIDTAKYDMYKLVEKVDPYSDEYKVIFRMYRDLKLIGE